MDTLRRGLVILVVACAVTGSSLVLGQAPPLTVTFFAQAQAKKTEAPKVKRAEAKPAPKDKAVVTKKAVVVQKAAVMVKRAAPAALAIQAQAEQYVQQFRPMFRTEYYFIRNTCGLTSPQRKQLARMGETAVRAAARDFAEAQQKMMQGGWRRGMVHHPDPQKFLVEAVGKSAATVLTPEQQARYKEELAEREASRKRVFIDNFVAKLDGDLVLTPEQRQKLAQAFAENWKESWGQSLHLLQNLDNLFPNVPDQVVAPILTKEQMEVWKRTPRNDNVFWGFNFGGMIQNDPLDDPELLEAEKEAHAAAAKK